MTRQVDGNKMSLKEFRRGASVFFPNEDKILVKNGKIIAKYSAKTKRVSVARFKKRR